MRLSIDLPLFAHRLTRLVPGIALLMLTGCATMKFAWLSPVYPEQELERHRFVMEQGSDVIGRLAETRVEKGDALPDLARHFGVGINAIRAANPGVDLWSPDDGERITLPLSFILPDAPRKGLVVNLAAMRLFHFREDGQELKVSTYPVGVGAEDRPTPTGQMSIARKAARPTWYVPASIAEAHRKKGDPLPAAVPPGPENPLGEYALYLSKAGYLIHGTNKPASVGLNATNGCLRLYPENIERLYRDTPVNTPVLIVDQPYLLGQRNGVFYLEAHSPAEGADDKALEKLNVKLKALESKFARTLDWNKVRKVQAEARGIPTPILELRSGAANDLAQTIEVAHPQALYGQAKIPELTLDSWYVLAGEMTDEKDAQRLTAIINHQGPPIPARVLVKVAGGKGYRVIAGPFEDVGAANRAARRLKIDLGIDGIVIDPAVKL